MMSRLFSINVGAGSGSGNLNGVAGVSSISNGASTVSVVFTTPFADTSYAIVCYVLNVTDATPIQLTTVITTKATTGFTATLNAPTDSANYVLSYIACSAV